MMTETAGLTNHLADDELVRFIDNEGNTFERDRWRSHVERCDVCAAAVALLDDQARFVSGWLDRVQLDTPVVAPPVMPRVPDTKRAGGDVIEFGAAAARRSAPSASRRRATTPWLRAAAALVLLAAPVAAYPPLRAWVGEQLGGRAATDRVATFEAAAAVEAAPAAASLRFAPAAGTFVVEFDAAPAGGTLDLGRAAGPEAALEVVGSVPEGGPVVSDTRLRIAAPAGATASYVLRLPAGVSLLTVRVPGQPVRTVTGAELDAGVVVRLGG
jgi:hypothetical protein